MDLREIVNATWDARSKWYTIGLGLDIPVGTLDAISLNNNGICESCYTKTLTEWLRRDSLRPTWNALAEALRSPSVHMRRLAQQLPHQGEFSLYGHSNV